MKSNYQLNKIAGLNIVLEFFAHTARQTTTHSDNYRENKLDKEFLLKLK